MQKPYIEANSSRDWTGRNLFMAVASPENMFWGFGTERNYIWVRFICWNQTTTVNGKIELMRLDKIMVYLILHSTIKWRQYWQFVPACTVLELLQNLPKLPSVIQSLRIFSRLWWDSSSFNSFILLHSPIVSHMLSINELIWSDRRQLRSRNICSWRNDSTLR